MPASATSRLGRFGARAVGPSLWLSALTLSLACCRPALGQTKPADESAVKAAFTYNFAKFAEWPAELWSQRGKLRLCLVGPPTDFGQATALLDGKPPVQGKEVQVLKPGHRDEAGNCHILVLVEQGKVEADWLAAVQGLPVLTVSDSPQFIERGGMIGLILDGDRVRFEVNLDAAQRARLKLSSHLLRLARSVKGGPGAKP